MVKTFIATKSSNSNLDTIVNQPYKYGFSTNIEAEEFPKGLSPKILNSISDKKEEPSFAREFRFNAYGKWLKMKCPTQSFIRK